MDELEKYYSETGKELVSLVDYHMQKLAERKRQGIVHPDDAIIGERLVEIKNLIRKNANAKREQAKRDKDDEADEMDKRTWMPCEACGEERRVEIIGEGIAEDYGWHNDFVKCTVCKTEFYAEMPNNWKDRLDYLKAHADIMDVVLKDKNIKGKKREEGEALRAASRKSYNDLAAVQAEVEKADKEKADAALKFEEEIGKIRDNLLLAKMKNTGWYNLPMGEA